MVVDHTSRLVACRNTTVIMILAAAPQPIANNIKTKYASWNMLKTGEQTYGQSLSITSLCVMSPHPDRFDSIMSVIVSFAPSLLLPMLLSSHQHHRAALSSMFCVGYGVAAGLHRTTLIVTNCHYENRLDFLSVKVSNFCRSFLYMFA